MVLYHLACTLRPTWLTLPIWINKECCHLSYNIHSSRLLAFVIALWGTVVGLPSCAAGVQERIISHSAAYGLKLVQAVSGSNIVSVEGFMSYDWSRRCDGWTNDQRLFLALDYGQNQSVKFKVVSLTWESSDGKRFRFKIKRHGMGQEEERIEGEASLKELGGVGEVRFEKPESKKVRLPKGTLFPTQHMFQILAKAISGTKFDRQLVFDGDELQGAAPITTVFMPKLAKVMLPKPVKGYTPEPVYPMSHAFFPPTSKASTQDSMPEFEMKIFYQANGVAPRIFLNYGDFKLRGDMMGFKKLPKPDC